MNRYLAVEGFSVEEYRGADAADIPDAAKLPRRRDYRDVLRDRGKVLPLGDLRARSVGLTEDNYS